MTKVPVAAAVPSRKTTSVPCLYPCARPVETENRVLGKKIVSFDVNAETEIEAQKDGPLDRVEEEFGQDLSDERLFAISFEIV